MKKLFRHTFLLLWTVCIGNALIISAHAQSAWGVKQLVQGWSQIKHVQASYVGQQSSVFFDEPIESRGQLSYEAPHKLVREIQSPIQETLRIEGDQLYIKKLQENEKKGEVVQEQQYTISSHEQLSLAIETIKAFIAGDIETLDKFFASQFSGDESNWQLTLEPLHEKVQEKYQSITLKGQALKVEQLTVLNVEDEQTILTITYNRFE